MSSHRETKQTDVVAMTLRKNAPRLTPSSSEGSQEYRTGKDQAILLRSTMKDLARLLNGAGGRTIDMTGLDGRFDFTLDWAKYLDPSAEKMNASIVDALRDAAEAQLGLQFKNVKAPVEVLVIDHAEKVPIEN